VRPEIINGFQHEVIKGCDVLLIDVAPLSLGVETAGEMMAVVIARNSVIPAKKSKIFTTYYNKQPAVTVKVSKVSASAPATMVSLGHSTSPGFYQHHEVHLRLTSSSTSHWTGR
jgi:molecular chaperone DnaK (HSP70)